MVSLKFIHLDYYIELDLRYAIHLVNHPQTTIPISKIKVKHKRQAKELLYIKDYYVLIHKVWIVLIHKVISLILKKKKKKSY